MYHHTRNEVSRSIASKVIARTDKYTHTHYENIISTAYAGGNDRNSLEKTRRNEMSTIKEPVLQHFHQLALNEQCSTCLLQMSFLYIGLVCLLK